MLFAKHFSTSMTRLTFFKTSYVIILASNNCARQTTTKKYLESISEVNSSQDSKFRLSVRTDILQQFFRIKCAKYTIFRTFFFFAVKHMGPTNYRKTPRDTHKTPQGTSRKTRARLLQIFRGMAWVELMTSQTFLDISFKLILAIETHCQTQPWNGRCDDVVKFLFLMIRNVLRTCCLRCPYFCPTIVNRKRTSINYGPTN